MDGTAEDQETTHTIQTRNYAWPMERKKELGKLKKQLRSEDDEHVHIVANDSQHDTAWS